MKTAFENIEGDYFVPENRQIEKGIRASRKSERKRIILPIHRKQNAPVQRMLNFLQPGTYIRPHLHPRPGASEALMVYQGAVKFILFNDDGTAQQHFKMSRDKYFMTDIEAGVWHSFVVLEPDTILFEVKMGPYNPQKDKTFAHWAPEESDGKAELYVRKMESL